MQIRNHVRTLALSSMLALSVMSPIAAHVYAQPNDGGGGGADATCAAESGMKDIYSGQSYKDGDTVSAGTKVHDSYDNKDWICSSDGTWHEAMVIQPVSLLPLVPHPVGAARQP